MAAIRGQRAGELTELLGVVKPDPATADRAGDSYRFERPVTVLHTGTQSRGFIDLYRTGHFVMEAKQGTESAKPDPEAQLPQLPDLPAALRKGHGQRGSRAWNDTMFRARNQADAYARAVSREDGWPPFLLIVEVGHAIEVYADVSGLGQGYTQFPDGNRYRIKLDDLRDEKTGETLRLIWTDPHALEPAKTAARITREVSDRLAALGLSFEGNGHAPETVARFLMRCLFTMFAEDVELIPKDSFSDLLKTPARPPRTLRPDVEIAVGNHEHQLFFHRPDCPDQAFQRRSVQGRQRPAPRHRATVAVDRGCRPGPARGGAVDFRHPAGTRPFPQRAAQAGRALHPARLCRTPCGPRPDRTPARRLGAGATGGPATEPRGQAGRGAQGRARLSPPALRHPRAGPGLWIGQLSVCRA